MLILFSVLSMLFFCFVNSKWIELKECSQLNVNETIKVADVKKLEINQIHLKKTIKEIFPGDRYFSIQTMFPSALWIPELGNFLVVVRIFINGRKSFVYCSLFDKEWNQVLEESEFQSTKLPTSLPIQVSNYAAEYSGPEDSRLFRLSNGDTYCIFNMLDFDHKRKMFLFSFKTSHLFPLFLTNYYESNNDDLTIGSSTEISPIAKVPIAEKNWAPLIINDSLNFVYSFGEFQVVSCKTLKSCSIVHGKYNPMPGMIKGGSPFVQFLSTNYYFSFTYTHFYMNEQDQSCIVYRPTLSVVYKGSESGSFEYVYTSEPMELNGKPFALINESQDPSLCGNTRIMMIGSVAFWDSKKDIAILTLNMNDNSPLVATVSGVSKIVSRVISKHQNQRLSFNSKCAEQLALYHFSKAHSFE